MQRNFVDDSHTSLLNVGFDRFGGSFSLCERNKLGNFEAEEFDVYVPIALGRIGKTRVDSTRSRCIEINIQRAKPDESIERFEPDRVKALLNKIRSELNDCASDAGPSLNGQEPEMSDGLQNRDADIWRFILSIADLAGDHWPELARKAATLITLNTSVPGTSQQFRNALQRLSRLLTPEISSRGMASPGTRSSSTRSRMAACAYRRRVYADCSTWPPIKR